MVISASLRLGKSKQACFCSRLLRRFGARYYNSDLSIWLSVDPMSDKYPNTSPYAYCANNPMKLVDPDGRWIPGLDDDGNVTYTAEKGDNFDTFIRQFDARGKDGKNKGMEIFKYAGLKTGEHDVKTGTIIKGETVKKATGSDVLKGNWCSMKDYQKASQIQFALMYGEQKKLTIGNLYAIDLSDFITGFSTRADGLCFNDVRIPCEGGKTITVNMRVWPKSGLEDNHGRIPIYWGVQSSGENSNTQNYYSAKNPTARNPLPAISITPCREK